MNWSHQCYVHQPLIGQCHLINITKWKYRIKAFHLQLTDFQKVCDSFRKKVRHENFKRIKIPKNRSIYYCSVHALGIQHNSAKKIIIFSKQDNYLMARETALLPLLLHTFKTML